MLLHIASARSALTAEPAVLMLSMLGCTATETSCSTVVVSAMSTTIVTKRHSLLLGVDTRNPSTTPPHRSCKNFVMFHSNAFKQFTNSTFIVVNSLLMLILDSFQLFALDNLRSHVKTNKRLTDVLYFDSEPVYSSVMAP